MDTAQPGVFKTVTADLFINLFIAVLFVYFLLPQIRAAGPLPDPEPIPQEESPNERPAAGKSIARVQLLKNGQVQIRIQDEVLSMPSFQQRVKNGMPYPDHILVNLEGNPDLQSLSAQALQSDIPLSLEISP